MLIGLVALLLAGLVFAGDYNPQSNEVTVNLYKGWNLVPHGVYGCNNSLGAVFYYSTLSKGYVGANVKNGAIGADSKYFPSKTAYDSFTQNEISSQLSGASWIYSTANCSAKKSYLLLSGKGDEFVNSYPIKSGWNFIDISPVMVGKTLPTLFSKCSVLASNSWVNSEQHWYYSSSSSEIARTFAEDTSILTNSAVGTTLIVKVASDCSLLAGEETVSPPSVPN